MNWYFDVLKKYVVFSGRARRQEYWMFFLFNLIVAVILSVVDSMLWGTPILYALYALGVLLPARGVTVRRLHDTGRTGWWVLAFLIPLVGFFVWIIFMV